MGLEHHGESKLCNIFIFWWTKRLKSSPLRSTYMDICEVCECHVCFNVSVKNKLSESNIYLNNITCPHTSAAIIAF